MSNCEFVQRAKQTEFIALLEHFESTNNDNRNWKWISNIFKRRNFIDMCWLLIKKALYCENDSPKNVKIILRLVKEYCHRLSENERYSILLISQKLYFVCEFAQLRYVFARGML